MISLEKLRAVRHLVTHERCADGVASAMIIKDALPDVKVTFVTHNTKLHLEMEPEEGMLFCDFTPPEKRVKEFVDAGVICLDHHKHAKGVVEAFGDLGVFADEKDEPGVSGAYLAYREVWLPLCAFRAADDVVLMSEGGFGEERKIVESFASVTGVRDTWQRHDPRWEQACAQAEALSFWPEEELLALDPSEWASKLALGDFLYKRRLKSAKKASDGAYNFTTHRGTVVTVFEGSRASSDAAELLGEEVDVVIGFHTKVEDGEPVVTFSTRSHTGYDVGKMCKSLGGGGHTAAAGFTYKMDQVPARHQKKLSLIERILFPYIYNVPPGLFAVRMGHLHPFYLAEKIVREYEGERV